MTIGKAKVGDKTLVDTLSPAVDALSEAASQGKPLADALSTFEAAAKTGMESTKDLLAKMGRASRLGERQRPIVDVQRDLFDDLQQFVGSVPRIRRRGISRTGRRGRDSDGP